MNEHPAGAFYFSINRISQWGIETGHLDYFVAKERPLTQAAAYFLLISFTYYLCKILLSKLAEHLAVLCPDLDFSRKGIWQNCFELAVLRG